jgi:hypothetical protein
MGCLVVLAMAAAFSFIIVEATTLLWNCVAGQFELPMTSFWATYCVYWLIFLIGGILRLVFGRSANNS